MRWLLCLWVVAFLLGAAQISAAPSWQCRVCEDAVQTWHDQFRCAGEFLDWGDELSPDIQGCQGPRFDCQKLAGQLKTVCLNTFKDFAITDKLRRIIWDNQMLHGDAYLTCAALGKCPKDPAPPQLLTACHKDFNNPSCGKNPGCANYTLNCPEECYVCTWLVRDFPLFGEICKPKGAALPQSVPQESDIMFLETDSNSNSYTDAQSWNDLRSRMRARSETDRGVRARSRARTAEHKMMRSSRLGNALQAALRARFMARANARAQVQAEAEAEAEAQAQGGGDADAPQTELQTGNTLTESCFSMWNEIKVSMKARYFVSWKRYVGIMADVLDRLQGTMWDANVVCKCLGRCELNRYEDLGLLETCKFDETDQKAMEYIFKDESKIQNINTAPGSESVGQTPPGSGQSV